MSFFTYSPKYCRGVKDVSPSVIVIMSMTIVNLFIYVMVYSCDWHSVEPCKHIQTCIPFSKAPKYLCCLSQHSICYPLRCSLFCILYMGCRLLVRSCSTEGKWLPDLHSKRFLLPISELQKNNVVNKTVL